MTIANNNLKQSPSRLISLLQEGRPAKIIHLDDEPFMHDITREILKSHFKDFVIIDCTTGDECWAEISRQSPDLLITDYAHTGIQLEDMLQMLRREISRFPIMLISGFVSGKPELRSRILNQPDLTITLLNKPFQVEDLKSQIVKSLLNNSSQAQAVGRNSNADHSSEFGGERSTRHGLSSPCLPLLGASTKDLFRNNTFRITGLAVDATTREVIRHSDKLKMLVELGQSPHTKDNAYPSDPPPSVDEIREAIQKIKDPEKRLIDEFFWFWPEEFGKSESDPSLQALAKGDTEAANEIWKKRINEKSYGIVAKHNLAVAYYLIALDLGHLATEKTVSEESHLKILDAWKSSVRKWGRIQDDDKLWEKVTDRIRQINEPSLPTGFARRMRASLPDALNKINTDLIFGFAESGRIEIAKDYIVYIRETNQSQNGFKNAAESVLLPAKNLLHEQIRQAVARGESHPEDGVNIARELLKQSRQALDLFDLFLGESSDERNELYDEVATICNRLPIAYHKATGDNKTCIEILRLVLPFVSSIELRKQIEENISILNKNLEVEKENEVFRNLSPIKAAPELRTINGIGLTLYGSTDTDPRTGSYLTTYYFVFLMIPLFPICRYRVTRNGSSYHFFGKAPLRTCDKVHIAITIGIIITMFVMISSSDSGASYSQSTYTPPPAQSTSYTQPAATTPTAVSSGNSEGNVYRVPSTVSSSLDREKAEIEADRAALNQLGDQVDALGRQIESDRLYLDKTSQYAVDEFNAKVDRYNTLSQQAKAATAAFNERVDSYNAKLGTYGR